MAAEWTLQGAWTSRAERPQTPQLHLLPTLKRHHADHLEIHDGSTKLRYTTSFLEGALFGAGTSGRAFSFGTTISTAAHVPVTIGYEKDGVKVPGTTLQLKVTDGVPQFVLPPDSNLNNAFVGCFNIKTGTDFVNSDAVNGESIRSQPIATDLENPNHMLQVTR
jgi:hypothetical protein